MGMDLKCKAYLRKVGERLRELRLKKGWTLEETEEHGWPSWQHLQKIEAGKNVTLATIWKVANLYKISPGKIFEGL